jgi:putative hydrolase of the HAD superfamily
MLYCWIFRSRLEFLQMLSTKYRLFLFSNTDAIHIAKFESTTGISFTVILPLLWKVYFLSKWVCKPDPDIYTTVINNHELIPKHTLFVDDKKKIQMLHSTRTQVWNLQVGKEDVIELFENK